MNSKIRNMRYLMILGILMIFLSGLGFLFSSIDNNLLKLLANTLIGVGLLTLATNLENNDNFKSLGAYTFLLSLLSFLVSYIFIGKTSLLGTNFNFYGNLSSLFMASLWLVVILLATLMSVRYKEYKMTHVICLAILALIFNLLNQFNNLYIYNLIAIAIVIMLFNLFKVNDKISSSVHIIAYFYAFLSLIFVVDENLLLSGLLVFINFINILLVMKKRKDVESQLLAILLIGLLSFFYAFFRGTDYKVAIFIIVMVLSFLEILINYANIIVNKGLKILFKIGLNIFYIISLLVIEDAITIAILSVVLLASSIVNTYIYKNDAIEFNIIPLKVIIFFLSVMGLLDYFVIPLEYFNYIVSFNFISLILAKVSKKSFKFSFSVITLLCSFLMILENLTTTNFLVLCLSFLINYFTLFDKNNKTIFAKVYYSILMLCLFIAVNNQFFTHLPYLIVAIVCGILIILNKDETYSFGITLPFFYFYISSYIDAVVLSSSISNLLIYILAYICLILFIKRVSKVEQTEAILGCIFFSLIGINILINAEILLLYLLLAVSLAVSLYSFKKNNYKSCYFVGLVFSILSILRLINYFNELSIFIYLLLIGILIIFIVNKMSFNEDKKIIAKHLVEHNYCGNCGNKLAKDDKYCGNCGEKCDED